MITRSLRECPERPPNAPYACPTDAHQHNCKRGLYLDGTTYKIVDATRLAWHLRLETRDLRPGVPVMHHAYECRHGCGWPTVGYGGPVTGEQRPATEDM